jgi:hypothetical protein
MIVRPGEPADELAAERKTPGLPSSTVCQFRASPGGAGRQPRNLFLACHAVPGLAQVIISRLVLPRKAMHAFERLSACGNLKMS